MGDAQSRPGYVAALREYLLDHAEALGPEFRERVEANPMRVLDTKVPDWQDVVERAPQLTEHLSDAALDHFEQVQEGLQALGIKYELAPRLVRGFDYYTRTTFEFQSDALDAAQNALGGGGRYDGLAEEMGGPPTPGIGFGTGIERLVIALEAASVPTTIRGLDAFVINGLGDEGSIHGDGARQRAARRGARGRPRLRRPLRARAVEGRGSVGRALRRDARARRSRP